MVKRTKSKQAGSRSASPPATPAAIETCTPSLSDSIHISGGRHRIEQDVQKTLLSHPNLRFSSLVVHRTNEGVCLEGVLESDENAPDVCRLALTVTGVKEVLNHLVVKPPATPAAKG